MAEEEGVVVAWRLPRLAAAHLLSLNTNKRNSSTSRRIRRRPRLPLKVAAGVVLHHLGLEQQQQMPLERVRVRAQVQVWAQALQLEPPGQHPWGRHSHSEHQPDSLLRRPPLLLMRRLHLVQHPQTPEALHRQRTQAAFHRRRTQAALGRVHHSLAPLLKVAVQRVQVLLSKACRSAQLPARRLPRLEQQQQQQAALHHLDLDLQLVLAPPVAETNPHSSQRRHERLAAAGGGEVAAEQTPIPMRQHHSLRGMQRSKISTSRMQAALEVHSRLPRRLHRMTRWPTLHRRRHRRPRLTPPLPHSRQRDTANRLRAGLGLLPRALPQKCRRLISAHRLPNRHLI